VGSLIFFTNSIHGLFLSSIVSGQEESIISNSTGLINKGKYLNNIGNYTEAIIYFDKVLAAEPNNTEALHGKGLTIDNFGNHTDAVEIYDEILTIDPDNMDALASKGVILYNTGNHTEAIKYFKKVLTLNSSTSNRSMFDKGVSYYGLGN
jgi:tetratricopeptide (TPR) repeat protein